MAASSGDIQAATRRHAVHVDIESLPIYSFKDEIIQTIRRQRVTLIEGRTGCGKSGMVPQFLIDDCKKRDEPVKIIVTQPRRIACINLAKTVAQIRNSEVGDLVGYQIGGDVRTSEKTEVVYATTGYFVESLLHNLGGCKSYTHIILDEVHERDLDIDLLACVIRELMPNNYFKVILMSATLQGELFHDYFARFSEETGISKPINVDASRFKVDVFDFENISQRVPLTAEGLFAVYQASVVRRKMEDGTFFGGQEYDTYLDYCFDLSSKIIEHLGEAGKTVLVFLPGVSEIERFTDALHNSGKDDLKIKQISLHSRLTKEEQEEAFSQVDSESCRVIAATNVAETSVTLPNVHVVIDFGLQKELRENVVRKITQLVTRSCSLAAANQRAGRTGRVCPGTVIRLYDTHSLRRKYDSPHIERVPLEKLLLTAKYLTKETLPELSPKQLLLRMVEPPEELQIDHALFKLSKIGAISRNDENADINAIGMLARGLPVDVELSRLVFFGLHFGMPCESTILAAVISTSTALYLPVKSNFRSSVRYAEEARESMATELLYADGVYSDPIMLYNIFRSWLIFLEDCCSLHSTGELEYYSILADFCRHKALRLRIIRLIEDKVMEIVTAFARHLDGAKQMGQKVLNLGYLLSRLRSRTNNVDRANKDILTEDLLAEKSFEGAAKEPLIATLSRNFSDLLSADVVSMKTLLLVSFNRNIVTGTTLQSIHTKGSAEALRDMSVKNAGNACSVMIQRGFDPERSIYFRSQKPVWDLFQELMGCVTVEKHECMGKVGLMQFSYLSDGEFLESQAVTSPTKEVKDVPLNVHVIKRISSGRDNLRFKMDVGPKGARVLHANFHQPFTLRWKLLGRDIIGLLDRHSLVGNCCNVQENNACLLGVLTKYTGTRNISYASFDGLTILPARLGGVISWLLLLCFHPGDCHVSVRISKDSGVILQMKFELRDLGTIDESVSTLNIETISRINDFRKDLSNVTKRNPDNWDDDTNVYQKFQTLLLDTSRTQSSASSYSSSTWIDVLPDVYSEDPFPAWKCGSVHIERPEDTFKKIFAALFSNKAM